MSNFEYANPYQTPTQFAYATPQLRLASRSKRFLGALIDNGTFMLSFVPGFVLMIVGLAAVDSRGGADAGIPFFLGGIALMFLGILVVLGIQIYLMAAFSQSIGKYLLKMQVLDFNTHQRSPFVQCFLLRSVIGVFLLNQVPFYGIIDACFIFREDYRCVHDLIGNSFVVDLH